MYRCAWPRDNMPLAKPVSPVLQRDLPLARGLVGAWPLSEGSGTVVRDLAGRNHGTIQGGAPWVRGPFGSALSFNGTSQFINTGNQSPINNGSTDLTVAAFINRTSTGANTDQIIANDKDTGTRQFNFCVGGGGFHPGNLLFETFGGGGTLVVSNATLNNNQLYFVGVAFDNTAQVAKMVINGVLDKSVACTGFSSSTNNITIGARQYVFNEDYFHGLIDDPLIANRALSVGEMAQLTHDGFAWCRPHSRWWEVPTGAAPAGKKPSTLPMMGAGLIYAADALRRNPVTSRRAFWKG